ncbi:hypothetical protein DENIS_3686 [Desulfonema ishimotonii]|uniref:Uncharacterized protein n=1 Tax=Desulfonema ishimotonii TaxID=45657 RepID=A0A401G0F4_9BACT|nr:hypothetical protein [Desulfonema ishimotonii]GBC62709.1 hypothetical protein DENIS_3686 [Desulfonema ishimotonii]
MNPEILVPAADPILVHWGWFKIFLIITFMCHILLMNIMVGSGIMAMFTGFKREKKPALLPFQADISKKLPIVIALAINFGVAPLLFLQVIYGQFIYVSFQLMAVYWLSVIGLLIIAYYSAYYYKSDFHTTDGLKKYLMAVAVLIFLFIGFLFTNSMTLMLNPKAWFGYFNTPDGTLLNLSDPTLIPRYLHFMTASVAVGGLFTAVVWTLKHKKGIAGAEAHITRGMRWFTYATLLQVLIGFWFQMSLPGEIMMRFMGGSAFHTGVFALGLFLVVQTLFFSITRQVWPTTASLLILVLNMIVMRDLVRTAYLSPYFRVSDLEIIGQVSPLILFLASLVTGIGIIVYVIRLALKTPAAASDI